MQRFKMFIMEIHCARRRQVKSNGSLHLHLYCFKNGLSPLEKKNTLWASVGERGLRTGDGERTWGLVVVSESGLTKPNPLQFFLLSILHTAQQRAIHLAWNRTNVLTWII